MTENACAYGNYETETTDCIHCRRKRCMLCIILCYIFKYTCSVIVDCNILIQQHLKGSFFFNKSWTEMLIEQGHQSSDYWIGLERLHQLTRTGRYKLSIDMRAVNGTSYWEKYDTFIVADSSRNYSLTVSGRTSNVEGLQRGYGGHHGMLYQNGSMFSTFDRDNDFNSITRNCARTYNGAWWHGPYYCCISCLSLPTPHSYTILRDEFVHLSKSSMTLVCKD